MERRNFLSSGVTSGWALSCLPTFSYAQEGRRKNPLKPFSVLPQEPLAPGPGNIDIRTIVRSKPTGMQFSNVECAVAPMHLGVPPHVHKELDELMYVLEGTATILIGDEIYEVEAGAGTFGPMASYMLFGMPRNSRFALSTAISTKILRIFWKNFSTRSFPIWSAEI